ncbi:MCE family protein [Gordonia sp. VNK21]|uniref:MCE family protein n=1 Tax=Gordonia sp. VNK21 TaxID=3382483 RepID=UPI0038D4BE09
MAATIKRRLLGLLFFVVVAALLALSILIYQDRFKSYTEVVFETGNAGNALTKNTDVKARGVLVGTVKDVQVQEGGDVRVKLALDPDKARELPAGTTGRVLPKTLFGERYVSLEIPKNGSGHLTAGAVVKTNSAGNAPEVEDLFDHLLPVLEAMPPQDLYVTLTSISQAIGGKGQELGQMINNLNTIFERVNANMPALQGTLEGLASFSQTYSEALPNIIDGLDTLRVTNRTIVEKQGDLRGLIQTLGVAATDTTTFLNTNRRDLIHLGVDSETLLVQLARQSPSFGCMFNNFATLIPDSKKIVGVGTENPGVRVNLQFVNPRGRYLPNQDEPRMWWTDPPARCFDLPTDGRPFPQYPGGSLPDGSYQPPSRNPGPKVVKELPQPQFSATPAGDGMTDEAYLNQMKLIYGASSGVYPSEVPTWITYTTAGALQGAEVNLK